MELRERLRAGLRDAMKQRDQAAVAALRTALSVVDNAEAADVSNAPEAQDGHIAGGVAGLGAGEVARRHVSDPELVELLQREVARWEKTADEFQRVGRNEEATGLRDEITALARYLGLSA
jgi:uncharacterized protein YqeY